MTWQIGQDLVRYRVKSQAAGIVKIREGERFYLRYVDGADGGGAKPDHTERPGGSVLTLVER